MVTHFVRDLKATQVIYKIYVDDCPYKKFGIFIESKGILIDASNGFMYFLPHDDIEIIEHLPWIDLSEDINWDRREYYN